MVNRIRQDLMEEIKTEWIRCSDENRREHEKLKLEIRKLQLYLLSMKQGRIVKVFISIYSLV